MSFTYLPVNLGFSFGPMLGSQLVKRNHFHIFPLRVYLQAWVSWSRISRGGNRSSQGSEAYTPPFLAPAISFRTA